MFGGKRDISTGMRNHYTTTRWQSGQISVLLVSLGHFFRSWWWSQDCLKWMAFTLTKEQIHSSSAQTRHSSCCYWESIRRSYPAHVRRVLGWLQKTFGYKLISSRTDCVWPQHSPDLSPLDFFSVGIFKRHSVCPKAIHSGRSKISNVTSDICRNVINNFKKRLDLVIEQKGRHVEHVL